MQNHYLNSPSSLSAFFIPFHSAVPFPRASNCQNDLNFFVTICHIPTGPKLAIPFLKAAPSPLSACCFHAAFWQDYQSGVLPQLLLNMLRRFAQTQVPGPHLGSMSSEPQRVGAQNDVASAHTLEFVWNHCHISLISSQICVFYL